MYRRFTFLVCALLSAGAWGQLSEPSVVRDTVSGCLNVRSDPNTSAELVACLPAGTPVTVTAAVPHWREILFGDGEGWAAKKFLEPTAAAPLSPAGGPIPVDAFLEIHFVDVGQGDAILIQTHDDGIDGNGRFEGYSIVIDGGPYSADTRNPLLPYLEERSHHRGDVEALIVTHALTDHYRGAETISRHFDIRHYYDPGFPSELSGYTAFLRTGSGAARSPRGVQHDELGERAKCPGAS